MRKKAGIFRSISQSWLSAQPEDPELGQLPKLQYSWKMMEMQCSLPLWVCLADRLDFGWAQPLDLQLVVRVLNDSVVEVRFQKQHWMFFVQMHQIQSGA